MSQKLVFGFLLQREELFGEYPGSRPLVYRQEDKKLLINLIYKLSPYSKVKLIPGIHFSL